MAEKGAQKETFGDKARSFGRFLVNTEEGTVLGRNGKSWAGIGLFYLVYYSCLAGFFAAALAIFYQMIDNKVPNLTGGDSLLKANPALGFRPMLKLDSTVIRFGPDSYQPYVDHLASFLKAYEKQDAAIKCDDGNNPRRPNMYDKACKFYLTDLDPCNEANKFGYDKGQPCVLIKLNRVYDWQPEPYSTKANDTEALPAEIRDIYQDYSVTVLCHGENPADVDNMGAVKYFPHGGFAYKYFPYINQEGYVSPVVMVKFMAPKVQTLLMVECRAYAKNIKYSQLDLDGAVHFELLVDFPPESNTTKTVGK